MKIKMFLPLLLCLCACFFQSAFAQENRWIYVIASQDQQSKFYEENVFQRYKNGDVGSWIKRINNDGTYTLSLWEFDCRRNVLAIIKSVEYDDEGNPASNNNSPSNWMELTPDSTGEAVFKKVCHDAALDARQTPRPKPIASEPFAEITTDKANLRETPSLDSDRLREIPLGETLQIVTVEPVGNWYKVYDKTIAKFGWLHQTVFKVVNKEVKPERKQAKPLKNKKRSHSD